MYISHWALGRDIALQVNITQKRDGIMYLRLTCKSKLKAKRNKHKGGHNPSSSQLTLCESAPSRSRYTDGENGTSKAEGPPHPHPPPPAGNPTQVTRRPSGQPVLPLCIGTDTEPAASPRRVPSWHVRLCVGSGDSSLRAQGAARTRSLQSNALDRSSLDPDQDS